MRTCPQTLVFLLDGDTIPFPTFGNGAKAKWRWEGLTFYALGSEGDSTCVCVCVRLFGLGSLETVLHSCICSKETLEFNPALKTTTESVFNSVLQKD